MIKGVEHWRGEVRGPQIVHCTRVASCLPEDHVSSNHIVAKCNRKVRVIWDGRFEDYVVAFEVLADHEIKLFFKCEGNFRPGAQHGHVTSQVPLIIYHQ